MRIAFHFLVCLALLILNSCSTCDQELHVFCWGDYIKPELIKKFEDKYHCCIVIDTFDSNESMYAKLKLGGLDYDIIAPSNYFIQVLQQQGMLHAINSEKVPNAKFVDPQYAHFLSSAESQYAVPFLTSFTGIAYRKDRIPHLEPTWNVFGNAEYKGRMTMLNDIREAFGAALKFLGYSLNTINPNEINQAINQLIKWKKNLAKFESELFKNGIASAEYLIVQGYGSDILQVMQENPNVQFLIPKEGSVLSIDCLAIPQNAKSIEMAHEFINFLLDPDNAAENMTYTLALTPNLGVYKKLSPELLENPILFPSKEVLAKSEVIKDLGTNNELYYRAWDNVKSAH